MSGRQGKKKCEPVQIAKVLISTDQEKLKRCSRCKQEKSYDLFNKLWCSKDGYDYYCRECTREKQKESHLRNYEKSKKRSNDWKKENRDKVNEYRRAYYLEHPEIVKEEQRRHSKKYPEQANERSKKYYLDNPEKMKLYHAQRYIEHSDEIKEKVKQWGKENPEKVKVHNSRKYQKRKSDPMKKLNRNMSFRVWTCLKTTKASRTWKDFVSFTIEELMEHLEKQFLPDMTWNNYGKWHVDHKIPLAAFSFLSPSDDEFKKAWALSNLQPMWGLENIKKGKKILHPELYKELTGR
jgi:hypothetical protein